ncbi:TetR/AcrR family transcriptional regulator [Marinomonas pollencensis]|uniref:TetR family transcriptional regulator n=1 Tax=Marinomonas pollencensis TaxID=491954 RepID=A0A3E0DMD5_9GAMM|nr:TetR/AcrR family transcriptional regulator [Marinomonas pollencensis]REG83827.1 TetR family transcriptional regulator [Marinomonas pollencensis]
MSAENMFSHKRLPSMDTKSKILNAAEAAIVKGGYGAFSFRDIAEEVGIKSASVHYHYPTKADLVVAVMVRFTHDFQAALPDPNTPDFDAKRTLNAFIDGFRAQNVEHHNMSICTMLTADKHQLSDVVSQSLADFYQVKLDWLTSVFKRLEGGTETAAQNRAGQFIAALHGASVLVQATGEPAWYEKVASSWRQPAD